MSRLVRIVFPNGLKGRAAHGGPFSGGCHWRLASARHGGRSARVISLVALLAVLSLITGIMVIVLADQTLLEFGSKTWANVFF